MLPTKCTTAVSTSMATQKPVELFARPMLNHLRHGEIAYEPFSGSGSQFMAAEQTGRICFGMEISPKYAAVALQRMADMGLEPVLANQSRRTPRRAAPDEPQEG